MKTILRDDVVQPMLTIMTSMGIGTGSFDLYLTLISFTMNTTTMITKAITMSHTLLEVILRNMISRV